MYFEQEAIKHKTSLLFGNIDSNDANFGMPLGSKNINKAVLSKGNRFKGTLILGVSGRGHALKSQFRLGHSLSSKTQPNYLV